MKLKLLVRLIEIIDTLFYFGIFLTIVAIILFISNGQFNLLLIFAAFATLLLNNLRAYLFKKSLSKTVYFDILISVVKQISIDKFENTYKEDFSFFENLPVHYSTNNFLADNNLKTHIGRKKWNNELKKILFFVTALLFLYLLKTIDFYAAMPAFIISAILLLILFWNFVLRSSNESYTDPIIVFSEDGLYLLDKVIEWNSIQSWEYFRGWKFSPGYIEIKYGKINTEIEFIMLDKTKCSHVDLLMLLYHFKKFYG